MITKHVVLPDQHVPFHDPKLHQLVCSTLDSIRPYSVILSGDFFDFPTIGKHRWDPIDVPDPLNHVASSLTVGRTVLEDYIRAAPWAKFSFIPGNHDYRFTKYIAEKAPDLLAIKDMTTKHPLLRLSAFFPPEVAYVLGRGGRQWPHGRVWVTKDVAVLHGWLTRSQAGATASALIRVLGHSAVMGHTHRQAVVFQTVQTRHGPRRLWGVEAGTLASPHRFGYTTAPDWQPGFAILHVEGDRLVDVQLVAHEPRNPTSSIRALPR